LAGAGFAAASLAACKSESSASDANTGESSMPSTGVNANNAPSSWDTPPEPIDDAQISEVIDTEVCILGAGVYGVVAAAVAAELGARVLVMQNKETIHSQGSGAAAFNSQRQTENFDDEFRSELVRLKSLYEGGLVNHELVSLWLDRSGEAVDWVLDRIEEDGVTASFDTYENWREADDQAKTCPISAMWGSPDSMGSMAIISALAPRAESMGAQFIYNTTARQLIREEGGEGRVVAALGEKSEELYRQLSKKFSATYDETASIGKRYRRQDEIGTPYCVTVDFDTLEDNCVTVRERDSMQQERISIDQLEEYLAKRMEY